MHILVIPSWYLNYSGDVGGSFFREQSLALVKRGYKVGVIYPQLRSLKDIKGLYSKPYGLRVEDDHGLMTYRWHGIDFYPKLTTLSRKRWLKIGSKLFDEYVRNHGLPDIIHAHCLLNAGFLAHLIYQKHKVPYLVTEHSTAFSRGLVSHRTIQLLTSTVEDARFCLGVSKEFSDSLNKIFSVQKWSYLPNIVNDTFLQASLINTISKGFTFINICFLEKKKRVDLLLHAFSALVKNNKDVYLKIGGDGPERGRLESLVKELDLEDRVHFLGVLSREQVLKEMQHANAFVLSSQFETFGVVLVEALALGKPVIATKCGGPESIITPDVGYLVSNGSVEELEAAMSDMYKLRNEWDGDKIRNYCMQNFSEEAVTSKLSALYREAIE